MTELEINEYIQKLRDKANIFEQSGCAVDGIVKDYRKSADLIENLNEKLIPKKPKGIGDDLCPNCGTFNSIIQKRRNAVGSDTVYCWHCGTAIECEV